MNPKIGYRETAAALTIFSLSPALLFLVGENASILGSGAWINSLFCFIVSLAIIPLCRAYFLHFEKNNIIDSVCCEFGMISGILVGIIMFAGLVVSGALFFREYLSKISDMTMGRFNAEYVSVFVIIVCTVCAYLGIEALSRQSYLILGFSFVLIFALFAITLAGWNKDNFYPVLGQKASRIFTEYSCFGVNIGLLPYFLICDMIKNEKNSVHCITKIVTVSHILMFILFIIYTATVPYPMSEFFDNSLEAIFASASSGEVMHRFDIFLLALYMSFMVFTVSLVLSVASRICFLIFGGDVKIYILAVAIILYNLSYLDFGISSLRILSLAMFLFVFGLIVILILFKMIKNKTRNRRERS